MPKIAYLYIIDYSKTFDSEECLKMWNGIRSMGMPQHFTVLIRVLYTEHAAKEQGETRHNKRCFIPWSVEYTQQVYYKNSMVRKHGSRCQVRGTKK